MGDSDEGPLVGFVRVDPAGYRTDAALAAWVRQALDLLVDAPRQGDRPQGAAIDQPTRQPVS